MILRISAVLRHYFTILWVLFRSCAVTFSGLKSAIVTHTTADCKSAETGVAETEGINPH